LIRCIWKVLESSPPRSCRERASRCVRHYQTMMIWSNGTGEDSEDQTPIATVKRVWNQGCLGKPSIFCVPGRPSQSSHDAQPADKLYGHNCMNQLKSGSWRSFSGPFLGHFCPRERLKISEILQYGWSQWRYGGQIHRHHCIIGKENKLILTRVSTRNTSALPGEYCWSNRHRHSNSHVTRGQYHGCMSLE
jgi:hypothetical protein